MPRCLPAPGRRSVPELESRPLTWRDEMAVAVAGPAVSLAIGVASAVAAELVWITTGSVLAAAALVWLGSTSVILALDALPV